MVLKIFKMIATSGFLTVLECTKLFFGRGLQRSPDSLAILREKGKDWTGKREGKKRGREGKDQPPFANAWIRPF